MRPPDIQELEKVIDRMVIRGGAYVPAKWQYLLQRLGVADCTDCGEWMWPTEHFLCSALPARDSSDLLRRAMIRDPKYRLHVDLSVCSVIHSVAIAERWARLEEILFGPYKPLMPRVAQILAWRCVSADRSARNLTGRDWEQASKDHGDAAFAPWDRYLWGEDRNVADLFSLLLDLYVPLANQPCFLHPDSPMSCVLIASLIRAARDGEGIVVAESLGSQLAELQDQGLPIRCERRISGTVMAYAVGAIACIANETERVGEPCSIAAGIPLAAKESCLLGATECPRSSPTPLAGAQQRLAIVSIEQDAVRWPARDLPDAPLWLPLPGTEVLASAAKRRSDSQDADLALDQLARHPLYGFLLQLFLLEALDSELGEETLAFALPQNRKLETPEAWAETKMLYRPRAQRRELGDAERKGFLVLGSLDDVLPTIAHEVGIGGVAVPYRMCGAPWSRAIYLMSTAGVIDGRPDRWILAMTNFILDRFHSGTLMKDFIRGGRAIRDQIQSVLLTLWHEKAKAMDQERIPA